MSAKIIPFPTPQNENQNALVRMLTAQLALAKEGKIKFCAIAAVSADGHAFSGWATDDDMDPALVTAAIGAVSFLKSRFDESVLAGAIPTEQPPEAA